MSHKEKKGPVEAQDSDENQEEFQDEASQVKQSQEMPDDDTGKKEQELGEQKDKYIRLFAEFENYKKRTAREFVELRQTAGRDVITSLLEILDDMDRAEEQMQASEEKNSMQDGVLLIFNKFRRILELKGLKAVESIHTEFDVEKDEAISEVPVEDEKLKGKVVAEIQKGYLLNNKLIRFAKVVVGK